ncbi:MAG: TonB-dependent receptor [Acidobacteriota bacterium]
MNSKWIKGLAVAAIVLLVVPAAFAQTTGRVDGSVVDDSGAALPGVTITLTSPSLQGDRVAVTGAEGKFRFVGLPVGDYDLTAALDGFSNLEQGGIDVGLGRTVNLQLTMSPAFGDQVTVSGAAPIIDTTSTTGGASFGEDLFEELPTTRTFAGLAFAAPGVVGGGLGDNPSIGGASAAENRYVIDGLDTTDPAFGTTGTAVPFEFIKEVEVKTGGYEAEFGGALGGILNVVTKSGGNELEGDIFGYWSDDSLQSDSPSTAVFGTDLGFTEYDFGAAVGGKLIQDKLWYFVAINPSVVENNYTSRGDLTTYAEEEESLFYAGKLTWQLNPSHQVVFSLFGDPRERTNDGVRNSAGIVASNSDRGANNYGVTYNGTLSSSLFAEVSVGAYDETFEVEPLTDAPFYSLRSFGGQSEAIFDASFPCYSTGQFDTRFVANAGCRGGTFVQESGDSERQEARGALTWFGATGPVDHEIKVGTTVRAVEYTDAAHYPGAVAGPAADETGFVYDPQGLAGQRWLLLDNAGGFGLLIEYDQDSVGETDEAALYVQDRVRLNDYFSLNLGVRADQFESTGSATAASRSNPSANSTQALDFGFSDMVAPRIGFTWDVFQNGRSKLYGHYGEFYESVPLDINARAFGNEQFNFYYFYYPTNGNLPTAANPGTHFYTYALGVGVGVSDDIEPMYTTETLVGFEYEVMPNVALGIKYTERGIENVIEDISVDGGQTYFITNPGGITTVNPVTGAPLASPAVFPEPVRDYEAIELTINKRFTNNWQLYSSYVNSENFGNYGGLFRQDNGQLDPNITSLYDLPSLLVGAEGLLPNDREHQFKIYGSYLWPFKLITGFYGQFLSGTPISQLGAHPIYGTSERFVTPRGSFGRTPDVWNLDLHVEYPIEFGNGVELKLIGDIFNVTDEQEATTVDQDWTFERLTATPTPPDCGGPGTGRGTACPNGNPNFGTPTTFQAPRTVRFGVKLAF